MHRRILASAAAAALTFGLVSCGDEGENGTVTTPPPSVSVGGSDGGGDAPSDDGGSTDGDGNDASDGGGDSTAAAPDIPAPDPADYPGMDQNTPEGAEQAFRYYVAVSMWSHQTGDTDLLTSLESDGCSGCAEFNGDLPKLRQSGRYWGEAEITDVDIMSIDGKVYDFEVGYLFILGSHSEPDLGSNGDIQVNETEYDAIGGMMWSGNHWEVAGVKAEWGPNVHD
ncbi:DUF6318 family protein [Brachybacterium epidermidis]|uniref:DUF6318 family protein n=1 Tax=Brachybacterium epidermidis TaxID=2781983 RepID=UPI00398F607D